MTWTGAQVDELLATRRGDVEAALRTIQDDLLQPLTIDVVDAMAPAANMTPGGLLVDQLDKLGRLARFAKALDLRVAAIEIEPTEDAEARFDPQLLGRLALRADAFRCRILVNHHAAGSGCLVGPSLVLTAWHVIAVKSPAEPQAPAPDVEVLLSDGSRYPARVPPLYASMCGDDEFAGSPPHSDDDVAGRNDVALLTMHRPAAAHLGYAPLPATIPPPYKASQVFLFDFPHGQDKGMGIGKTAKIRGVTARWLHDIPTDPGSSGGAAFGDTFELLGLHQAKWGNRGRVVPSWLFLEDIRSLVDDDRSPASLWTLDPTLRGRLVIGRDPFVQGIRAAARPVTRIRGVRVKRRDPRAGPTGLAFSYELLLRLLSRLGPGHRPVRITFEEAVPDLEQDLRQRLAAAGVEIPPAPDGAGVEVGQAALEAVLKDRSRVLADAIDAAAHARDETVWLFLDNASISPSEPVRLFLEGFVASALVRHRIRLVITGFETTLLAGEEYAGPADAEGDGAPGFVVEYLGGFTARDAENLLARASLELLGEVPLDSGTIVETALQGLTAFNNFYADDNLPAVAERLQRTIDVYLERAGLE